MFLSDRFLEFFLAVREDFGLHKLNLIELIVFLGLNMYILAHRVESKKLFQNVVLLLMEENIFLHNVALQTPRCGR